MMDKGTRPIGNPHVNNTIIDITVPVPEPSTMLLLGMGLIGIAALGKRFRKR